jgi:hypothetical protein
MDVFLRIWVRIQFNKVSYRPTLLVKIIRQEPLFQLTIIKMAFTPASRDWSMVKLPTKTTTAYVPGGFVYSDGTNVVPATTSTQGNVIGICQESKLVGDAGTQDVHILVPNSPNATFRGPATGTLTKPMEGLQFDFASDVAIAQAASTYDTVTLVKFISATEGVFKLNTTYGIEN